MTAPIRAAGGVVWRQGDLGLEIVLVRRSQYDDWSLPKGKAEPDESDEQCALREVQEETGLPCELGAELPGAAYLDRKGREKVVRYWAMRPLGDPLHDPPDDEIDEVQWLPVVDALVRLTYERDREIVAVHMRRVEVAPASTRQGAPARPQLPSTVGDAPVPGSAEAERVDTVRVLVVRHGVAIARSDWAGADHKRPLNGRGVQQAAALPLALRSRFVTRLLTSPTERCRATLQPLADARGVPVEDTPALNEGRTGEALHLLCEAEDGTVVCTHGDVITGLLDALAGEGVPLGEKRPDEKGSVWVLEAERGRFVRGAYIPPQA